MKRISRKIIETKNLFILVDKLICYEIEHGVKFDDKGLPLFYEDMFLDSLGETMVPFNHRNDTSNKAGTIVCFYEPDIALYRKLTFKKLDEVASELKLYKGFVGFDLSIFKDFLYPFQEFYILANLVISMFFVLNGCKLIPNLRADQTGGESYFGLFKKAPIVCCGTLGCSHDSGRKKINKQEIDLYCENHPNQIVILYGSKLSAKKNVHHYKAYGRKKVNING